MSETKRKKKRVRRRPPPHKPPNPPDSNDVEMGDVRINIDELEDDDRGINRMFSNEINQREIVINEKNKEILARDEIIHMKDTELLKKDNDWNSYATSKSVSQNFLNTTSIASQITLLVLLFASTQGDLSGFQIALVVLIVLSLSLQFVIFVLLVILAQAKSEKISRCCTATIMNSWVTSLTGLLMIITSGITAVSLNSDISGNGEYVSPFPTNVTN